MIQTKTCSFCGKEKPLDAFYFRKDRNSHKSTCKECDSEKAAKRYIAKSADIRAKQREYRRLNPEVGRARTARWRESNPDRSRDNDRRWRLANLDRKKKSNAESYQRNKQAVNERAVRWRLANPEAAKEALRKWRATHPPKPMTPAQAERYREYQRQWIAERRSKDPKFRLQSSVRSAIWRTLQPSGRGGGRTFAKLGYSRDDLIAHLERQFAPGMSWDNYGEWHVDHIRPLASFSYESHEDRDFKEAWSLSNLQPLWGADNQSKGAKWEPEQEAAQCKALN